MSEGLKLCAGAWGFRELEIPAYLDACARLEFPFAEMNVTDDPAVKHLPISPTPEVLDGIARAEKDSGVKVACLCADNNFTGPDAEAVERSVAEVKSLVNLTADCGAEVIRLFAGFTPFEKLTHDSYRRCGKALAEVGEYAQPKGVLVAVENHGGPAATAAQVLRLLELAGHPNVKANYDGGNFACYKEDPLAAYAVLRERIGYTHWKDVYFQDGAPHYCALGDGITDWTPVVQALLTGGYDGYWTMEYEEPGDVEVGMKKSIDVVLNAART